MGAGCRNRLGVKVCSLALAASLCASPLLLATAHAVEGQGAGQPQEAARESQVQDPSASVGQSQQSTASPVSAGSDEVGNTGSGSREANAARSSA